MIMRTSLVFIISHSLAYVSSSWRPDPDAAGSPVEVSLGPKGRGHVEKDASKATKAKAFTHEEFLAAFNDDTRRMPEHMMDSSFFQSEESSSPRLQIFNQTHDGQSMRGVLDFFGYAFAIAMDRKSWTKELRKVTFGSDVWEAKGRLYFKLLRYPPNKDDQATFGRHKTNISQVNLQDFLVAGWAGSVDLVGWWNDDTMHFRGNAVCSHEEDKGWLNHAMLPWRELDLRFDNEGAHARFDWYHDRSKLRVLGAVASLGMAGKAQWSYGIFRLDALPSGEDAKRTYQGMLNYNQVLFSWTLKLDDCEWQGKPSRSDGKWDPESDKFKCIMEERPISIGGKDAEEHENLYRSAPFGAGGDTGPWFSTMGMKGSNDLLLEKGPLEGGGSAYSAIAVNSNCWGTSPCPFTLPKVGQRINVQFHPMMVVLQLIDDVGGTSSAGLYPIFDEDIMSGETDQSNCQGFANHMTTLMPMISSKSKKDYNKSNFDFQDEGMHGEDDSWDSDGGGSAKQPGSSKAMQDLQERNDRQAQKIAALEAVVKKTRQQQDAGRGRDDVGPRTMQVECPDGKGPGDTIQVDSPSGGKLEVQVPAGVEEGMMFTIQY